MSRLRKELLDQTAHLLVGLVLFTGAVLLGAPPALAFAGVCLAAMVRELFQHRGFGGIWSWVDVLFFAVGAGLAAWLDLPGRLT